MDIQKFLELLEHYPAWFKASIALWVLLSALLVVGFLMLRQPHPELTVSPLQSPSPPPERRQETASSALSTIVTPLTQETVKESSIPFDDYAKQLRAHSDRFMERQDFVHQLTGNNVTWEGTVDRVSEGSGPSPSLSLMITTLTAKPEMVALVGLPNSMSTKAFSLHKGDIVRVTGILRLNTPNFPDVEGTELVVIKVRSGG